MSLYFSFIILILACWANNIDEFMVTEDFMAEQNETSFGIGKVSKNMLVD